MFYQNIMTGINPWSVHYGTSNDFPSHAHYELEFIYVIEGKICAIVNDVKHEICAGEIICINSMVNHYYVKCPEKTKTLNVEFGPVFIGEDFKHLTKKLFEYKIMNKESDGEIADCFDQLIKTIDENGALTDTMIKSILYRLFVLIAEKNDASLISEQENAPQRYMMSRVQNAITLVQHRYKDPLTINDAAAACGYGKSVFCKLFKNAVGVGFHQYLNAHRIEISKHLLSETETPINCIADIVGYKDTKTFYRLFKASLGVSPGEYRKKILSKDKKASG